jgi:hypothetical protein
VELRPIFGWAIEDELNIPLRKRSVDVYDHWTTDSRVVYGNSVARNSNGKVERLDEMRGEDKVCASLACARLAFNAHHGEHRAFVVDGSSDG